MGENESLSYRAKLIRELVAEFNHNDFLKTKFREEKRAESEFDKVYRYPDNFTVERLTLGERDRNFNIELVTRNDHGNDWVLLQLHGGGYVGPFKNRYRAFAKMYSEYGRGMSVLNVDYRVAPEHPFPAALEDAVTAYEWLIARGYPADKIILAGDSAGGGLAMALCHWLKDRERELPAGIIAMSPWTDLALTGESYEKNFAVDPIFGNTRESLVYDNPYAAEADRKNPYVSPLYGDFDDFPPMLIQVGGDEMLLSDAVSVAKKAKQAGSKVKLSVYDGMFHVFQLAMKLMPESVRAWNEIERFLNLIMRRKNPDTFRLALVERNIVWEDKKENLKCVSDIVHILENRGIDLAALPEMSLTGFSMNTKITAELSEDHRSDEDLADEMDEFNTIREMKKLARQSGMSIGVGWVKKPCENEITENDMRCENHYSIVSPDEKLVLDYVKIHPFSYAGEDKYFRGGEKLDICSMGDLNIGTAICYDLRFPEQFIKLSDKAQLILVPANWPAARSLHWSALLRARAIENQCYMAGVNCCGDMGGQAYSGDSAVYGPEGELLTPIDTIVLNDTDRVYIYDIVNNVTDIREKFPVRNDRKN